MTRKYDPIKTVRIKPADHKWFSRKAKTEGKTQSRLFSDMKAAYSEAIAKTEEAAI